jgi:hypothetical protein
MIEVVGVVASLKRHGHYEGGQSGHLYQLFRHSSIVSGFARG